MLEWIEKLAGSHARNESSMQNMQSMLAHLPVDDAFKSLEELTFSLQSISKLKDIDLAERYRTVVTLEKAANNYRIKLSDEYLNSSNADRFRENLLWVTLYEYWKHLAQAYLSCVDKTASMQTKFNGVQQKGSIHAQALNALGFQLQWSWMRYGPVEANVWKHIGHVYHEAETRGILDQDLMIKRKFVRTLLLSISAPDTLLPTQLEIAADIVDYCAIDIGLEKEVNEHSTHLFDLSLDKQPVRIKNSLILNSQMRFFSSYAALNRLNQLSGAIKIGSSLEEILPNASRFAPNLILSTIHRLSRYWDAEPPVRNFERKKVLSKLIVVLGFNDTVGCIDNPVMSPYSEKKSETWMIKDSSEGGFRVIVPENKGESIHVGALIGIKAESNNPWGVGIIRRIERDHNQQRYAGIELITKKAVLAVVKSVDILVSQTSFEQAVDMYGVSLLLNPEINFGGPITILMRDGSFNPNHSFKMQTKDGTYLLKPERLVERSGDFDLAIFSVTSKPN